MKRLPVSGKILLLVGLLVLSYYLGRPIYWEVMSRTVEGYGHRSDYRPLEPVIVMKNDEKDTSKTDVRSDEQKTSKTMVKSDEESTSKTEDEQKTSKTMVENDEESTSKTEADHKKFKYHKVLQMPVWKPPPKGTSLPPREAFALTKEMIDFRAKDNVIIVTFANHAFGDFVLTWVRHLTNVGVTNLLVGAMDRKLLEELFWKGVPVFDMGSEMNTADVGWGTPTFHKMGREKVYLVNEIMAMGFEVLFCDTDMVWLKNPLPYMMRYRDADILVSSDAVVPTVTNDALEDWGKSYAALNIGIFHWRPSESAKKFAKAWQVQLEDEKIWDQNGFNELMQNGTREPVNTDDNHGLFYAYDGKLKVGILPVSIFCSGHTYFVQHLHKQFGLEGYAVHTTFQFAGTEGKRHRLREAKLFFDKPEYYTSPGGFVTYNASIPEELLTGGAHTVETHFALVNYQLRQVRQALAISSILNRTLVMPPLWCRFDRLWFGHPGILQETKTPQPFLCPMDHIFEVQNMLKPMPEDTFGPAIDFREYSFLENPAVSDEVKSSKLTVQICQEDCPSDSTKGTVHLSSNMTDEQIGDKLIQYKDVKVLEFTSMQDVFGGFVDKEKGLRFRKRVQRYTGIWCCLENMLRGHIYYDIFWDEKPGWKPIPPLTQDDDHPALD